METGFIVLLVLISAISCVVGFLLGKRKAERRYTRDTQYTQGTLTVDCSDPEFEPGMFLACGVPVNDVITRKYVKLDVNVILQNSQK